MEGIGEREIGPMGKEELDGRDRGAVRGPVERTARVAWGTVVFQETAALAGEHTGNIRVGAVGEEVLYQERLICADGDSGETVSFGEGEES